MVTVDHRVVDTILTSQEHLDKHLLYSLLTPWLGNGLLLSTGKAWSTMRKIITPTFHFKILEQFLVIINRQTDIFIEKLKSKADGCSIINIEKPMSLLTLDVIAGKLWTKLLKQTFFLIISLFKYTLKKLLWVLALTPKWTQNRMLLHQYISKS